ncbi:DUF5324 family protein [Streptomyces tropicalis]|uniref:DUF5324 family protein n=1 Tax=Streptomyces tropicalis TaxID=3034234 RepID=A0ABT6A943_9ACTN|nr:DUF5324 family protein [Streptomyces tropicalis]MDF3300963.1 DUF5324 family protein [Streptomyces tropicalis]
MTRIDSVRAATGSAKDSVLHAADVVAPYADTAMDRAAHYANEARVRLAPKVSLAADQARVQYDALVAPRLEQARTQALAHVPPKVDQAAHEAAARTRKAARQAAEYSRPRIEQAVAAATPVADEAAARSAAAAGAAVAALRGRLTADELRKLARKHDRRARAGRAAKVLVVLGVVAGGAFAAWKWWDKQANPDWLVEPPAATEVPESGRLTSVDGSGQSVLDPEVEAKEAEEGVDRDDRG